ncbi:MAG: stage III sporulation protein AF [Firmicutes bacterium]|jgi:stage III sporulation protein AF|nr:stage III sporulation protein AF [Bacillota bacterium]
MLEAFSAYIKNIAVFTLFAAFAELLMPENNFKKYLSIVMGLLLLTAVLKPMLLIFQRGSDLELQTIQKTVSLWAESNEGVNTAQEKWNDEMILDIYKKELEQKWTQELQNKFHTDTVSVLAEFSQQPDNYGQIISVSIVGECERGEEMKEYMKSKYDIERILIEDS